MSELDTAARPGQTHPLGVSRPPLDVVDLPTPEEVFGVSRLGVKEIVKFAIGPSLIALGISIGSGEWLLGPLNIGQFGFKGLGWVILVSAILQTFYNVESSRYVVATGEVPALGFGRAPPGFLFWVPFSVAVVFFAFIWGGWAASAGQGLFSLITGRLATAADLTEVRLLAIGLLGLVFVIAALSRKVTRGLEPVNWLIVGAILLFLFLVDIFVVPGSKWWEGFKNFFVFSRPPEGITATNIGALAGFTALASGLNWYVMTHYRDKGYGMGHRVGFISGLRGAKKEILPVGVTFPDDDKNAQLWKRWYRLLLLDMWGVFFVGAMLGMLLPTILMSHAVDLTGQTPTDENIPTFIAGALKQEFGSFLFYVALLIGTLILFSTQLGIFEAMIRNFTDGAYGVSSRFRRLVAGDPRRFYYPFMLVVLAVVGVLLFQDLPVGLIRISANMSNFGALMFPFVLMYLNSKLPRAARPSWYHYVILVFNVVFFGFFFINFAWEQITGDALFIF
ncbi:MAG: Nramp family divalent metal transporter [Actinomycetota bacterium]